jgi:predicted RNA-binding Zn-ribbon protein involved in translation (DUF1610 family)
MFGLGMVERLFLFFIIIAGMFFVLRSIVRALVRTRSRKTSSNRVITPESNLLRACKKCGNVTNAYHSYCPTCGYDMD